MIYVFFTALVLFVPLGLRHACLACAQSCDDDRGNWRIFHQGCVSSGISDGRTGRRLIMVVTVFMIIGSLPFGIFLAAFLRGAWRRIFSPIVRFSFSSTIVAGLTIVMMFRVLTLFDDVSAVHIISPGRFSTLSRCSLAPATRRQIITPGGRSPIGFFFCIMFIGGCAGSTSCGMKVFRFQVALAAIDRLCSPSCSSRTGSSSPDTINVR